MIRALIILSLSLASLMAANAGCKGSSPMSHASPPSTQGRAAAARWTKPAEPELRRRLSPLQYQVTQRAATEPPFQNAYWDNHAPGIYVDIVTGEPLFSSRDKFDSGTGWPSFSRPIAGAELVRERDASLGVVRVEARSKIGGSHLGHVFPDGPAPTHERWCINSAALRFIPLAELGAEGYADYRELFSDGVDARPVAGDPTANACVTPASAEDKGCAATLETAILAGGCFWGMEELLRGIPGVLETEVGYTGGALKSPTYEDVKTGRSGHAEAVRVVFDPAQLSYADLLERWFFRMHDPTTRDRQGNDRGSQYRSAIFVLDEAQRRVAREVIARVDASGLWPRPVVTEVVTAGPFTAAEGYHQGYLKKHPGGYTCHFLR